MKTSKKIVSLILVLLMAFSISTAGCLSASAAGSSMSNATSISLGSSYSDSITSSSTQDFYKFTLSASGRINIKLTAYIHQSSYYIYDSNGKEVWRLYDKYWNDVSKQYDMDENVDLTSGTYYFAVKQYSSYTGSYNFRLNFTSAGESFKETTGGTNNTMAAASSISTNSSYYGQLSCNDDCDFYKFTLSASGRINIKLTAYIHQSSYYIYDSNGKEVWRLYDKYWNDVSKQYDMDENVDLTSGTYYFAVKQYSDYTGNYSFRLNFTSAGESFKETTGGTNNTMATASSINMGSHYYGQIASNDDCDFYKFTSSSSGKVTIKLTAYIHQSSYYIYDSNGKEVWRLYDKYWNDVSKKLVLEEKVTLSSGVYYFAVKQYSDYTGDYDFTISGESVLNAYKLTYNANGGSGAPSAQTGSTSYTVSSVKPTRSGYTFLGWSKSSSATSASYTSGDRISLSSDTTLYAVWQKNSTTTYKLTYNANGGSGAPSAQTGSTSYTISSVKPTRSGYTFLGWSRSSSATSATYTSGDRISLSSNTTLYAVWQKNATTTYKLTYDANGGSGAPSAQTGSTSYTVSSVKPTRSGYKFLGWAESESATTVDYTYGDRIYLNEDTTLYAVWEKEAEDPAPSDNSGFSFLNLFIYILEFFVDLWLAIISIFF